MKSRNPFHLNLGLIVLSFAVASYADAGLTWNNAGPSDNWSIAAGSDLFSIEKGKGSSQG